MNLDLFKELFNNIKEKNSIHNFIQELSDFLEKKEDKVTQKDNAKESLEQEKCLYQVIDMDSDGVYLQNTQNNYVFKEMNLSKDFMNKIGNDFVLKFENGRYEIEENITQKFFDSLVEAKEYERIRKDFIKKSNILVNDSDTIYKIKDKGDKFTILTYGEKYTLKVPNELIPFWSKDGDSLNFVNERFNRKFNNEK